ncbi:MAG: hypothetical protein AB4372_25005 [Xenococcus sp. (in: cyanobacteria)]
MKHIIKIATIVAILTACSAVNQPTENEKTAIAKLERIHSDLELGLNIGEYKQKVSDAKFSVEQVNKDSEIIDSLDKAVEGHSLALDWWRCKLEVNDTFDSAKCRDKILNSLFTYSPTIKEKVEPHLKLNSRLPKSWNIDPDQMLKLIWNETQIHLIEAQIAIKITQSK